MKIAIALLLFGVLFVNDRMRDGIEEHHESAQLMVWPEGQLAALGR